MSKHAAVMTIESSIHERAAYVAAAVFGAAADGFGKHRAQAETARGKLATLEAEYRAVKRECVL